MNHNKKISIFLFTSMLHGGGAERVASTLSQAFKSVDITLILEEGVVSYPYKGRLIILHEKQPQNKSVMHLRSLWKLGKLMKDMKPDIVMCFLPIPSTIAVGAKVLFNYKGKLIMRVSDTFGEWIHRTRFGLWKKLILAIVYKFSPVIVATSDGVRVDLMQNFDVNEEKIKVIHNPFDIHHICKLAEEEVEHPWFKDEIPIIISVGRLTEAKAPAHCIKAFSKVRRAVKCRLVIIGTGELRGSLEELCKHLELKEDVVFLGWQDNPFKYVARASVFVLSSLWEGFANVIVEAMALGIPVVSTDCPSGPREIITDGLNGILVPVGNIDKMAEAIIKVLSNTELALKLSNEGRKRAHYFHVEKIIREYEEMLVNVYSGRWT